MRPNYFDCVLKISAVLGSEAIGLIASAVFVFLVAAILFFIVSRKRCQKRGMRKQIISSKTSLEIMALPYI